MKKIKNNTGSTKIWRGQEVAAGAYYTIQEYEYDIFTFDSDLQADITSGDAIFNDGTQDITDPTEGLDLLKAISASCIRDVPIDDTNIADNRILKYNDTTKKLEYVDEAGVGSGITSMDYTFTDFQTNSTTYVVAYHIIFKGTAVLGTPTNIKAICNSVTSGDIRIYDVTNALVVCELLGVAAASPAIFDLGTLSNLPSGEAIFEIQVKKDSTTMNIHGLSVYF